MYTRHSDHQRVPVAPSSGAWALGALQAFSSIIMMVNVKILIIFTHIIVTRCLAGD